MEAAGGSPAPDPFDRERATVGDVRAMAACRGRQLAWQGRLLQITQASALLVIIAFVPLRAWSATITWTGSGDGSSWSDPANWDLNQVPGPGDDVIVNEGTLTLPAAGVMLGTLTVNGGTLTGAGAVTVTGPFTWTGGQLSGSGTVMAAGGLTVNGGGGALIGQTLVNKGTATISSRVVLEGGAVLSNAARGTLVLSADDGLLIYGADSTTVGVTNGGTLKRTTTTGTAGLYLPTGTFTNSGTVSVESGTLQISGAYTQTGTGATVVSSGATLQSSSPLDIQGGTLSGNGTVAAGVVNAGQVSPGLSPGVLTITGSSFSTARPAITG
jgi:hypothetical protein